jgi:hypothetical protein
VAKYLMKRSCLVLLAALCWFCRPADASAEQSLSVVQQATAYADSAPSALLVVGETAKELFDAARLSNWPDADVALQDMKTSAADLPNTWSRPDLASQLQRRLAEVEDTVSARQRVQTMDFANGITRLVADLSAEYQTPLPYALVLLDYYGRELELGIAAGDQARLKRATADLRQTWNRFQRIILQRGAVEDARRFTDSVAQLEGAQTPGDFVESIRAELAAVDRLNKIFKP